MKLLVGDQEIDLPKAGFKSFTVEEGEGGRCLCQLDFFLLPLVKC
jgi:hypothetical protein